MKSRMVAALVAVFVAGVAIPARADDDGRPKFSFGAALSWLHDFNRPDHQVTGENRRLYSDGHSEDSFNVDLVQLGARGARGRVSYGAKADFGDWARQVQDNIENEVALQEAFLAIDAGFGVISAGRMPTPLGYEVLEPWANANISRSRAWYFQAISHDGVAVSGEAGGVTLMAAAINGLRLNDGASNNPDGDYGAIASASIPLGSADLRLTVAFSDERDSTRYVETSAVVSGTLGRWRYGLEGTWLDGSSHGSTVAPDLSVGDVTGYGGATFGDWSADGRLSFTHQEGTNSRFPTGNDEGIVSFTATAGYRIVEGVVVRAEYRVDSASRDIFDDHDSRGALPGFSGQSGIDHVIAVQLLWTPLRI